MILLVEVVIVVVVVLIVIVVVVEIMFSICLRGVYFPAVFLLRENSLKPFNMSMNL